MVASGLYVAVGHLTGRSSYEVKSGLAAGHIGSMPRKSRYMSSRNDVTTINNGQFAFCLYQCLLQVTRKVGYNSRPKCIIFPYCSNINRQPT